MGGKIEKSHGGAPPGPRGGAEAGERSHRENKVKILSKKVPDTQANPRYSAKNNVAIRMISTFIAKHNKIYNPDLLIYTCSNITFHNLNSTYPFLTQLSTYY